jgi:hypothetical protein
MMPMAERWAVPMREIPTRVIEVSRSGCLIESRSRIEVGTVGTLELQFGTEACEDHVMVVRCEAVPGAGAVYQVGMRFLWTTPPRAGSIRHVVGRYIETLSTPDTTRVM